MEQKPYLNLGCGTVILPSPKPAHHGLVDSAIYDYPLWLNVDRNAGPGVNKSMNVFEYPWAFEDNSFDGALLSHIAEHIPHEIKLDATWKANWQDFYTYQRAHELQQCQDGWYAFFSELWRVCTPGAIIHVLSPYGWSQGAITDPTHTRLLTEQTFTHSMQYDPDGPFHYETAGLNLKLVEPSRFTLNQLFSYLIPGVGDSEAERTHKQRLFEEAIATRLNVVYDFYTKLEVIK